MEQPPYKDSPMEQTLFNMLRERIPVLQHIAKWQGYDDLSTGLNKKGPVEVLYTKVLQNYYKVMAERNVDYAATSRNKTKRLTADETERMVVSVWEGKTGTQDNIVMRNLLQHLLPLADGRRSEDLREVSFGHFIGNSLKTILLSILNTRCLPGMRSKI